MGFEGLIALFLGVMALAAKPGPGMVTVATKAVSQGILPVLYFMVGTNLVKILFFLIVIFGLNQFNDHLLFLSILIKAVAALYLISIGIKGLQKFSLEFESQQPVLKDNSFLKNFNMGFIMTLSNPFDILFFAGVVPTIIQGGDFVSWYLIGAGMMAIVAADSIVALSYAIPLSFGRSFFKKDFLIKLNFISCFIIILVGIYIGYTALPAKDLTTVF